MKTTKSFVGPKTCLTRGTKWPFRCLAIWYFTPGHIEMMPRFPNILINIFTFMFREEWENFILFSLLCNLLKIWKFSIEKFSSAFLVLNILLTGKHSKHQNELVLKMNYFSCSFLIFIGPRCLWGPIYRSASLSLTKRHCWNLTDVTLAQSCKNVATMPTSWC